MVWAAWDGMGWGGMVLRIPTSAATGGLNHRHSRIEALELPLWHPFESCRGVLTLNTLTLNHLILRHPSDRPNYRLNRLNDRHGGHELALQQGPATCATNRISQHCHTFTPPHGSSLPLGAMRRQLHLVWALPGRNAGYTSLAALQQEGRLGYIIAVEWKQAVRRLRHVQDVPHPLLRL